MRVARSTPALTVDQIAVRCGCSPSTVRRHLHGQSGPRPAGPTPPRWDWDREVAVARDQSMLWRAARDPSVQARVAAARHRGGPVSLLRQLGSPSERSVAVREQAAANPNAAGGLLSLLTTSAGTSRAALRNPNCPPRLLAAAALRGARDLRRPVSTNPSCPPAVLAKLSADNDRYVRLGVAVNRSATPQALARLSASSDTAIRATVAGNKNCPPETLALLCEDADPRTRTAAQITQAMAASPGDRRPLAGDTRLPTDPPERSARRRQQPG